MHTNPLFSNFILEIDSLNIFLICTAIFFVAVFLRYLLAAGVFYLYYYRIKKDKYQRLSKRKLRRKQLRNEIYWSSWASAIFAIFGTLTYWLWQEGYTAIYFNPYSYGIWYLPLSLLLILLIHETYYYWVHRAMHHPTIYRKVHKVHHDSLMPTPWAAFSFHPWESLLEAIILPLILIFIPVNIYVLGFYLIIMTLSSVINHLDIEIFPKWMQHTKFGKLFIGATHHHYHHSEFKTNYGLYFTFWDRLMGTESKHTL